MVFHRRYGKELRIIGHFNKLTLEQNRAAILAEPNRLRPLMKDGGYPLVPDHLITPGVSLADYHWYLDQVPQLRF